MNKLLILTILLLTGCSGNAEELIKEVNSSASKCMLFNYENNKYVICTEKEFDERYL